MYLDNMFRNCKFHDNYTHCFQFHISEHTSDELSVTLAYSTYNSVKLQRDIKNIILNNVFF